MGRTSLSYVVEDSGTQPEDVLKSVNRWNFECFCADYSLGTMPVDGKIVANPISCYDKLLRMFVTLGDAVFQTMEEFSFGKACEGAIRIAIRHDVDTDITTALELARLESRYGVRSAYYVLHTAPYYGVFRKGVFHRHEKMISVYREIQNLGHEVGLHIDPLSLYQDHNVNGAQAVVEELRWLRSEGIQVRGTACHNCYTFYGVRGVEDFREKVRDYMMPGWEEYDTANAQERHFDGLTWNGKWAYLHDLDVGILGLRYVAEDAYLTPGYVGALGTIAHNVTNQSWSEKTDFRQRGLKNGPADFENLGAAVRKIAPGEAVVFLNHPCYYGARHRPDAKPPFRLSSLRTIRNAELGWATYEPGSAVAVCVADKDQEVSQSISFANEFGVISKPFKEIDQEAPKVLVLGGKNFDGRAVGIPDQFAQQLEKRLREVLGRSVHVRSFAFPGMGVARYSSWYRHIQRQFRADAVLMGIDSLAVANNHPDLWPEDELSDGTAGGSFLEWCPDSGGVRFADWKGRRDIRPEPDVAAIMAGDSDDDLAGIPVFQYVSACYRHLASLIRKDGSVPFVVMEDDGEWAVEQYHIPDPARFSASFRERVESISGDCGMEVIDPYPALRSWRGPGSPTTLQGLWSSVGHRLVAEVAAEALSKMSHRRGAA